MPRIIGSMVILVFPCNTILKYSLVLAVRVSIGKPLFCVPCEWRELMRFQFFHRITVSCLAQIIRLLVRRRCDLDLVLTKFFSQYLHGMSSALMLNGPLMKLYTE